MKALASCLLSLCCAASLAAWGADRADAAEGADLPGERCAAFSLDGYHLGQAKDDALSVHRAVPSRLVLGKREGLHTFDVDLGPGLGRGTLFVHDRDGVTSWARSVPDRSFDSLAEEWSRRLGPPSASGAEDPLWHGGPFLAWTDAACDARLTVRGSLTEGRHPSIGLQRQSAFR